ncbi:MAG TPA: hypothetical protein VLD85_15170 [Anaeromyxobacteraceae bacterium]|nr:hypothetical protein [Anaeromyxobacteraceae bacterium]
MAGPGCPDPASVNPGAFDVPGNGVDDDCSGAADDAPATCDVGLASNSSSAADYAAAIDLCQTSTGPGVRWGVLSAGLVLADGTGAPDAAQASIRPAFGGTASLSGSSLVVLSTGHAAATGQANPSFIAFQPGLAVGTSSSAPADWLAANGGAMPAAPGCPAPSGTTVVDPVMLVLRVRVPTNARSFELPVKYLTSDYPEWACSPYDDRAVVLLDSSWTGSPANPGDKNLAVYRTPGGLGYPLDVNLATGNTGLFTACVNGNLGCTAGATPGTASTCTEVASLAGTGLDGSDPGNCDAGSLVGGGTGWLAVRGNVVGGEIITLRIGLWDTSDGVNDSVALLDGFRWSTQVAQPGLFIR